MAQASQPWLPQVPTSKAESASKFNSDAQDLPDAAAAEAHGRMEEHRPVAALADHSEGAASAKAEEEDAVRESEVFAERRARKANRSTRLKGEVRRGAVRQ